MLRKSQGFTLIELMIVVAVIGILASFAMPVYQGYVIKTQLNRAVSEVSAYKSIFEEQLSRSAPVTNTALGYTPSGLTSGVSGLDIAAVNPDGSGHIEVTLAGSSHSSIRGVVLRLQRSNTGDWNCLINSSGSSDWKAYFVPSNCSVL